MVDIKKLLEIRKDRKTKKPVFIKQNGLKKIKVGTSYRKPRGFGSRMRIKKIGYPVQPSSGYMSPVAIKYKNKDGMNFFIVNSFVDLKKADVKKDSIVIAGNVGARKSIELYKKAKELNFKIENFDDKRAETLLATFEKKKSLTKKKNTAKEEKVKAFEQATKKEAKKETKKAEPKKDANEEKKEEIKEQEKILTGKNTAM